MAGVDYDIQIDHAEIARRLRHLGQRIDDLHDVLNEMGEVLVPSTQARMVRGVAPDGSDWTPLAPSTLLRKKGPGILRERLTLMGSIHHQVEGDELHVGTGLVYAAVHQFGGKVAHKARQGTVYFHQDRRTGEVGNRFVARRKANFAQDVTVKAHDVKIPARPYLGLSPEDEGQLLAILWDYVMEDFATSDGGGGAIA